MIGIKRLDTFMLQRFVPLLVMTFFICLFIVLMQFLFRMIDDLVGKGLGFDVLAELFFYAALTMVPMALPLAVLLASLMVFGNLGEKLELTAMKAAGISLFRIMRPLIVLMCFIAVGAFYFQNNIMPVAQSKMWTLTFSVRQKTPEVEIPEKSFYGDIPGMNLYIDKKDAVTGMLYGMIIYDVSRGMDNSRVILADSGKFTFTEDKTRLLLELHHGEMFENLTNNSMGVGTTGYMPFRREHFTDKDIYFAFDANFNRMDESGIRSQYVGQNVSQLRASIDSIGARIDSIGDSYAAELLSRSYVGIANYTTTVDSVGRKQARKIERPATAPLPRSIKKAEIMTYDLDSVFNAPTVAYAKSYLSQAISNAKRTQLEFEYRSQMISEQSKLMRRHDIEMQRKFTLSFAVMVFFFIGAPLGAIIKKGGLGTPLVISVFLFIVYYIIDNTGFKMSREGKIAVWQGIWLSTAVLLPLGIFFTIKAVDDSAVFNADAYKNFLNRLIGRLPKRSLEVKEVVMNDINPAKAYELVAPLRTEVESLADFYSRRAKILWLLPDRRLRQLQTDINLLVDYLSDSTDKVVINLLNQLPFEPTAKSLPTIAKALGQLYNIYKPEGLPEEQPEGQQEEQAEELPEEPNCVPDQGMKTCVPDEQIKEATDETTD